MKLSMRNKFLLPTLGVLVLAMLVAAVFSYLNAYDSLYASMERELNNTAILARDQLRLWIVDRKADVANWGRAAMIKNVLAGDKEGAAERAKAADAWLADLAKSYTHYEFLGLMGPDGKLAASSNPTEAADLKLGEREFFKTALSGKPCLSKVWISKKSGHPVFAVANPVEADGRTIGVFLAVTDLAKFSAAFIDKLKFGKTGYAYLFQEDGLLLAHPGKKHILTLDMKTFDFGRKMMRDKNGTIVYTWKDVEKIVVYRTDTITNWTVGLGAGTAELMEPARRLGWLILIVAVVSLVVACVVIFMVTNSIISPLRRTAAGLKEGASEVSQAATMMASASQELAEGASEQASALEQSSSSLEQMASMTHQSTANAQQADSLMRQAGDVIGRSDAAMRELTVSMADISRASEETAGIIRTIDEIAFQTNLLALNAAVEAARAGEAGAGFAVVADEVRNLAMRAAEAAKSTAQLIEGTLEKVKSGTALVDKTAAAFGGVSKASLKVGELVGEISAAATEQDQGIDQVNRAVVEIDKLTQKNASGSEEIASVSEELSAQSAAIEGHVQRLLLIMNGQSNNAKKPRKRKAVKLLPRP